MVPNSVVHYQLGKLCAYLQSPTVSAHVCGGRLALGGLPARAVRVQTASHNRANSEAGVRIGEKAILPVRRVQMNGQPGQ